MDLKLRSFVYVFVFVPLFAVANSGSHHQLIELTGGRIWTEHDQFYEMGLDWEYFLEKFDHHFSFGVATELEFERQNEFYAGPLVSMYFDHIKYFLTTGLQGRDSYWQMKIRIGLGYEYYISEEFILVPNVTADYISDEIHPGLSLGLAYEY